MRRLVPLSLVSILCLAATATAAAAPIPGISSRPPFQLTTGGTAPATATLTASGIARAPAGAPQAVKWAIWAGNQLQHQPYVWGGGHASFRSHGYDCSGTVSFVLHAAGLLPSPLVSGALAHYGQPGPGRWITIYANRTHTFMYIAGLRLDTSGFGASGPRWRPEPRSAAGFKARHPAGL